MLSSYDVTLPRVAMIEEALCLMRALSRGIVADETAAGEVARLADAMESGGQFSTAEGLRVASRHHRIRALEARFGPLPD